MGAWSLRLAGMVFCSGALLSACQNQPAKNNVNQSKLSQQTIVGGQETVAGAYPFMVSLQSSLEGGHYCGATLIAKRYLITAAHCTFDMNPRNVQAVFGLHQLTDTDGSVEIGVEDFIEHPLYDGLHSSVDYDYSIVKLSEDVDLNRFPPAQLNETEVPNTNGSVEFTTMGWGLTSMYGRGSNVLREAKVPYVDVDTCRASYPDDLTEAMLCAGFKDGGVDACQMDSGGPLVIVENNTPVLYGVVSWGEGCAQADKYGVYSKISFARDWILETINN